MVKKEKAWKNIFRLKILNDSIKPNLVEALKNKNTNTGKWNIHVFYNVLNTNFWIMISFYLQYEIEQIQFYEFPLNNCLSLI